MWLIQPPNFTKRGKSDLKRPRSPCQSVRTTMTRTAQVFLVFPADTLQGKVRLQRREYRLLTVLECRKKWCSIRLVEHTDLRSIGVTEGDRYRWRHGNIFDLHVNGIENPFQRPKKDHRHVERDKMGFTAGNCPGGVLIILCMLPLDNTLEYGWILRRSRVRDAFRSWRSGGFWTFCVPYAFDVFSASYSLFVYVAVIDVVMRTPSSSSRSSSFHTVLWQCDTLVVVAQAFSATVYFLPVCVYTRALTPVLNGFGPP